MCALNLIPHPPAAALEVVQDREAARCLLHPVRLRIVEHLVGPDSASGVARRLKLPRQRVNYHLRELERHGLVRLVQEETHGAGTERRLQAQARAYALGPRLLGRLSADRSLSGEETPEARILRALTRAIRELAAAGAGASADEGKGTNTRVDEAVAVEVDVVVADAEAMRDFTQDLQRAVELLSERYRTVTGPSCHVVLAAHPAAPFAASLPPPIA